MDILKINSLSLNLNDKQILNNLSLDLTEGKIYAVVGPNGAGKSSFASVVMGLEGYQKISGEIKYFNDSIKHQSISERAKKGITLSFQEPARFEGLTVRTFLEKSTRKPVNIGNILEKVGLDKTFLERNLDKTLSGGERKRIEFASILAMKPKLALLDEPDSGIDVGSLELLFEAIKELKEDGTTIVLITHSPYILKQAEFAFLMCHGQIVDQGSVAKISKYFEKKCIICSHQNKPDLKNN